MIDVNINNSIYILMCSTRREQQPTVSADSSASFSLPALRASLSIKYIATALWRRHNQIQPNVILHDHIPLSDSHFFANKVFFVLFPYFIYTPFQSPCSFVFSPILLSLFTKHKPNTPFTDWTHTHHTCTIMHWLVPLIEMLDSA